MLYRLLHEMLKMEKYGPYPIGHKAKIDFSEFVGPCKSLKDLEPVDDNDPIKK